jgi:sec-independent protein translocase protein TatA
MGLGGLHIWHLLILGFVVMTVFGTSKLKNLGEDLGGAIQGFKKALNDDPTSATSQPNKLSQNFAPGADGKDERQ